MSEANLIRKSERESFKYMLASRTLFQLEEVLKNRFELRSLRSSF